MVKNYNEVLFRHNVIETKRLILRRFCLDDAADLFECTSHPDMVKYLDRDVFMTVNDARAEIADKYLAKYGALFWAAVLKESGKVIGSFDLQPAPEDDTIGVGMKINQQYWGRGLGTEGIRRMLSLCFDDIGANRVEGVHYGGNTASGRVLAKCGMTQEYVARQGAKIKNGVFVDVVYYGITRGDYYGKKLQ